MEKTKANFRALREACGLTQSDIAAEADVRLLTAKRWENPNVEGSEPPEDVWDFLRNVYAAMQADAQEIADAIAQSVQETDGMLVELDYYRTQEDLDAVQLGSGVDEPVGYVNARARLVAMMLEGAGIACGFRYR